MLTQGVLFVPIVALFFFGMWLVRYFGWEWAFCLLILSQKSSTLQLRKKPVRLGGISSAKRHYVTATGFRMAALAIIMVGKPFDAYGWATDPWSLQPFAHPYKVPPASFVEIVSSLSIKWHILSL